MKNQDENFIERLNRWLRESITVKMVSVGTLALLLLLPTVLIMGLIDERETARNSAIYEVSEKWGHAQTVTALVLSVPYLVPVRNERGEVSEVTEYAHFLPDEVTATGTLQPEMRYRGIYEVVLYNAQLKVNGRFSRPDFKDWNIDPNKILWKDAFVSLGLSHNNGIREGLRLQWGPQTIAFNPGVESPDVVASGVSARVPVGPTTDSLGLAFAFDLNLNGASFLRFAPLGQQTKVTLSSPWANPSFSGAFLPAQRNVTPTGFQANWQVLHLNRNYPQKFRGDQRNAVEASAFGVDLMIPVDQYQKSARLVKYALLIIGLTFTVFFFAETLNGRRVHAFQYILVGLALCLFYTLQLALAEHMHFNWAYVLAASATVILVTAYCTSIFAHLRLALLTGGILAFLYGFMFTLLQLQDYTLLLGSVGLFVVLAIVMYLSRRLDWDRATRA
ncbi:MAG: cell envelope integrity protein CreD [Bernardetiaceae bacterium]|jgi:inner membrane protein|nr:cell envelope integrity protein CreD [Bernardetiaceae bacterium]